jgi:hypothetical protein
MSLNPENFIVVQKDNENFEIIEKLQRESVDGEIVTIKEPRGSFNLPAMYGEKANLEELLMRVTDTIGIIENFKNSKTE